MRIPRNAWTVIAVLGALLAPSDWAWAQMQDAETGWKMEGEIEAGGRSFIVKPSKRQRQKFEEYRDIPEGAFLSDFQLRFFRPDESYSLGVSGSKWGQQDQEFSFNIGRLGLWEFGFDWDEMRHVISTTAKMLATEPQHGVFVLPSPRPALATYNTGRPIDEISVRWDTSKLNFKYWVTPDLELVTEYTRIHKDGDRPMGFLFGSPGGNFMEVLQPIDQTIHDFRVRGNYATPRWQLQASYMFSAFENELDKVLADNPCFGLGTTGGCTTSTVARGQASLPPNNTAHQLSIAGGVNLPLRTRINGNLAWSVHLQDQGFLPHTINPAFATNTDLVLPRRSLNGNAQTWLVNLGATTRPFDLVTFGAKYRYYEYDDWSDTMTFQGVVVGDASVSGSRSAGRWSFSKHNADLDARVHVMAPLTFTLGTGWERWDRNFHREVPISDEFYAKAALDWTPTEWLLTRLTYRPSWRRIDEYNTHAHAEHNVVEDAAAQVAGQSVLLRKFDESDRDRQKIELSNMFTPFETLGVTHTISWKHDEFISSPLGVDNETSWSTGIDVSWTPLQRLTFATGYTYESIEQKMRSRNRPVTGTTTFDFADYEWISNLADTVHTVYARTTVTLLPKVLDLVLGGTYSSALGRIETRNPGAVTSGTAAQQTTATAKPMPAFEDTLLTLEAALRYHFLKNWMATFAYYFESFEKTDWRTDTLDPFMPAAGSSIWLGSDAKNYTAHIVALKLSYRFK